MPGAGMNRKAAAITSRPDSVPFPSKKSQCQDCPHKEQCQPKMFQRKRRTEYLKKQSPFRNGVETISSILCRKYGIDKIPVRGLIRNRFFFGCKIGELNIKKLCRYMQGWDKCAHKVAIA